MARFHFVEDYELLVAKLIETHPIDEAMSIAVGGHYVPMGEIEADVMQWAGLKESMAVFDLGCGSGRLAHALAKRFATLDYLGADIVLSLLEYAATKPPRAINSFSTVRLPSLSPIPRSIFAPRSAFSPISCIRKPSSISRKCSACSNRADAS